ncbi:LOW QUALITY PROTEIN: Hypothetical protein PHPALM_36688 [Phytophthora palmivora]|uniref:NPP1-like protein n=1 Tax=Phytophthora palmivora TaxID=4796 RepID=A0A2P4WZB4_9STRA|nr:LOW QUALITY PROTEIN: Hypothetical protein PHPALM_36688 [Phytophthora palmivora]
MNLQTVATILVVLLASCATATIDHDKMQPIPQPEPVTVSEKAAVLFKLNYTHQNLSVFPVNVGGEVTGGLKGTNGNDACKYAPKGSQVYGRSGWYKDHWAITYAWYFPKGFNWIGFPSRHHDWKSVIVWIDNPAVENPKILGVSMSKSDSDYRKETNVWANYFAGYRLAGRRYHRTVIYGSSTSLRFEYNVDLGTYLSFSRFFDGNYQDLIMWEQLPAAGREAFNNNDNFGRADVPFNDENYEKHLENAWLV